MACCKKKIPLQGVLVVLGGIMIHLTLGTQLTVGNTNPYYISYIRKHSIPSDLSYADGVWVYACIMMGQGITMFIGGILELTVGLRMACLAGSWFFSAGVVLTHWSLKYNYLTSLVTCGVMFGLGCGIAYPMPVSRAIKWFPERRGLVVGLIIMGFGLGPTIFNPVIAEYLNPDNLAPNLTVGEDVYFTQDEVLDRVPSLFLILGGTYAVVQLVGVILMVNPPSFGNFTVDVQENKKSFDEQTARNTQITERHTKVEATDPNVSENDSSPVKAHDDTPTDNKNHPGSATETYEELRKRALKEPPASNSTVSLCNPQDAKSIHNRDETRTGNNTAVCTDCGLSKEAQETPVNMDIPPLQMLRNKQFYILWLLFLFTGMGAVLMTSIYKSYGQSFIKDDQFFALVGSCASISDSMGSIFWGYMSDRFSFDSAMKLISSLYAGLFFTFAGSELGMKPYFLIWVCLIHFITGGKFSIMPAVTARMFGTKYFCTNYGLLFTSQILMAAASAFMGQMLKDVLHYHGLFYLTGGLCYIGFLITFFMDARTPDGKKDLNVDKSPC